MYVTVKCSIKDIFDTAFKSTVLDALSRGIRDAVDANKGFSTKKSEPLALVLTTTASLTADDKAAPKQLKAVIAVDGVLTGSGAGQAFKATGNGTMSGVNAKKLDRDVTGLIDDVVGDLMKNKVIPQMLKMNP